MTPQRIACTLAVLGATAIAIGVGLYSTPAGVICAGVEALAGAYLIAYFGGAR